MAPVHAAEQVCPGEAWDEATPESQGVDGDQLNDAVRFLEEHTGEDGVRELVIVRHGRIIWKGDAIDRRHGVWSCTKSFTSTVLGLLIADGKCTLDTRVSELLPECEDHYRDATLRHFATMTSGYRAVGDETDGSYKHGPSNTPFLPNPEPLFTPPGSQYAYWDSAMNTLALALTKVAGEPMRDLFARRVAEPVGMRNWDWGELDTVDGVAVNGGSGNAGKHVLITAPDMARFGLLYLRRGRWGERQVLPESWVDEATAVQVPAETPWAHPESEIDGRGVYGFNWWRNGIQPDGTRRFPDATPGTFWAAGFNNNFCFVVPEWDMVIVRLGLDGNVEPYVWNGFFARAGDALGAATRVSLQDRKWRINGLPTNLGSPAEGLLMNVRMVNASFEDLNRPEFDPDANTNRFLARIPEYVRHGVNAFTLCLQGGMPGYEGAVNSAFEPDGSLREDYLRRIRRIIRACDREGAVVILGCYYQRQSKVLRDEAAVQAGVLAVADWIRAEGFANVVVEIANEYPHGGFVHHVIRDPEGQAGLIRSVQGRVPGLLVTASGVGDGGVHQAVAEASDFLTPHWNGTPVDDIPGRLTALRRHGKSIVVNEDDKAGEDAVAAMKASVENGAAYGLMLKDRNQTYPFRFDGAADDPVFYEALKAITSPAEGEDTE